MAEKARPPGSGQQGNGRGGVPVGGSLLRSSQLPVFSRGGSASDYSINPTNIANAWNSGQLIVLSTSGDPKNPPPSSFIVPNHDYAVVGYNASSSLPFQVFNPWGSQSNGYAPCQTGKIYGLFNANSTFVSQNFVAQGTGTGAANVYDLIGLADEPTEPATLHNSGPKKFAIVHGNGSSYTAVSDMRPAAGTATVGGPLS